MSASYAAEGVFAREIVKLWRQFATALGNHSRSGISQLQTVANSGLTKAIKEADLVLLSEVALDMARARKIDIPELPWSGGGTT